MEFDGGSTLCEVVGLGVVCSCSVLNSVPLGKVVEMYELWVVVSCALTYSRCQILRVLNQGKVALCDKWLLNWKCHLLIRCDIKIKNIQVDRCYMTIWMVHCMCCVVCTSLIKNISEMIAARRYKVCNNIMTLSNVCRGYNVTCKSTLK